jgi:hypothetical protein
MNGIRALSSSWGPWPGGGETSFERDAIVAIGKLRNTGDNRIKLIVRLTDGSEVFVNASKQPPDDGSWLYKAGKDLSPGHDCVSWKALT